MTSNHTYWKLMMHSGINLTRLVRPSDYAHDPIQEHLVDKYFE